MATVILATLKNTGVLGAAGGIGRSADSGATWSQAYTYAGNVMGLCSTPGGLFAITYNGRLLKSVDIGVSWSNLGQIDATANTCTDIGYIGNNTLVVGNGSSANSAFISYDLGSSWSVLLTSPNVINRVLDMGGGSALLLGSVGNAGYESKTTDYGATWNPVATIANFKVYDAVHTGSGVVIATGGETPFGNPNKQIYRSADYGSTWSLVYDVGFNYWGVSVTYLPSTNYAFATFQDIIADATRPLYRSPDLGLSWVSLGNQGALALYGGSGSSLYSGRTTILCPFVSLQAAIKVSYDLGGTFPASNNGYDPTRFLEVSSVVAPVADFSGSPVTGLQPLNVSFTDLSTNTPTSWLWDFGVTGTSTLQNPSYNYTEPGFYTVSLDATNAGGSDNETKINYITVYSAAPVADFTGSPLSGDQPLTVTFTDSSTNTPTSWMWDFGDGGTSALQNPLHQYTTPGTYTVSLQATNVYGTDTEVKTDYITVNAVAPVADFSGTPLLGYAPLTVAFTDESTSLNTISWLWTFGDGYTSTVRDPVHTYASQGKYTVSLKVLDAYNNDTETKIRYVQVGAANSILKTPDEAVHVSQASIRTMAATGDGEQNFILKGIRYYIPASTSNPEESGFRRQYGPGLIAD